MNSSLRLIQTGFSLIEMLIAITLMAVVSIISWNGLESVINLQKYVENDSDRSQSIQHALAQLERDLEMRAPTLTLPQSGRGQQSLDTVSVQRLDAKSIRLEILRSSQIGDGTLQQIQWWRDDKQLVRTTSSAPVSNAGPKSSRSVAVLDQITDFSIRAYVLGQGWTQLPMTESLTNATGFELTVGLTSPTKATEVHRRVVRFP